MEKYIRLLQSNYGCVSHGYLYSVSENHHVIFCVETATGKVILLDKPPLRNRVEGICIINENIYMIDMAGKWIAEAGIHDNTLKYYETNYANRSNDNFAFIANDDSMIFMLMRHEPVICAFDTQSKSFETINIGIELGNSIIESAFMDGEQIHIFSSGVKKRLVYDVNQKRIIEQSDLPINERVMSSLVTEGKTYIFSGDCLYHLGNECKCIARLEPDSKCVKMCKCGDLFWILPGTGEKIYTYNSSKEELVEYKDYPEDFGYEIPDGCWKYVGNGEDEEYAYWCMRAGNYILKINKGTGDGQWLMPHMDNKHLLFDKAFLSQNSVLSERTCTLQDYIEYISSK